MAIENPRTIRVLKLVFLLCGSRSYSLNELKERLSVSDRTIYRDLETLENVGFSIGCKEGRYRIDPTTRSSQVVRLFNDDNIAHDDAAGYGHDSYNLSEPAVDYGSPLNDGLTKILEYVKIIWNAIHTKKAILMTNYRSSNGRNISNRLVEPFKFSPETQSMWAFEPDSSKCKQFKVTRLSNVEILNQDWKFEKQHKLPFTDIFNLSAEEPIDIIKLELPLNAYNLMVEEFPKSKAFISDENPFVITVPVAGYEGIGRFVMGLIDSIKVINSEKFKAYLKEKMQHFISQKSKS